MPDFVTHPWTPGGIPVGDLLLVSAFALLALIFAIAGRASVARGVADRRRDVSPEAAGYFARGHRGAILAALAGLRAAGAVYMPQGQWLRVAGPAPAIPSDLAAGMYHAAAQRAAGLRNLAADPDVHPALRRLRESLVRGGWLMTKGRRRAARLFALPLMLTGLAWFGYTGALMAGLRPFGERGQVGDAVQIVFVVPAGLVFWLPGLVMVASAPKVTRTGRRALAAMRTRHAHLRDMPGATLAAYGPAAVALAVGLFGFAVLQRLDPGLAANVSAAWPRGSRGRSSRDDDDSGDDGYSGADSDSGGGDSGGCGGGDGGGCGGGGDSGGGGGCGGGGCGGGGGGD